MITKFDENARTFKTRLEFIRDIFQNKQSQLEIIASSIQYKLGVSYLQYLEDLKDSLVALESRKTMTVMKRI